MEEPIFNNYKEKQNYYKEMYKNRGETIHLSKMIGRDDKVLQQGSTYHSDKGDVRRIKRQARKDKKSK